MKIRQKGLVALMAGGLLLSQLSGCGGGGSGSSASSSTTLSGTAMAGAFLTGQACAYKVTAGAKGDLLGTCVNLASSAFSIDIGNYTGDVLIEIPAGATYDDEANPNDNVTGTTLTGALRTLINIGSAGGTLDVAVTPLTETAVRLAGATLDAATMQAAINQVLALLPTVTGLDLRGTVPASGTDLGLAYLEMLRALSQLQWVAGGNAAYAGGLDAYLATVIADINSGGTFASDLLNQVGSGLANGCTVSNGTLSCTVSSGGSGGGGGGGGGGGSGALTCNTAHYQAGAVRLPTSTELASFAQTYAGNTGTFDMNGFTATGPATLVFSAAGELSYNGAAQTVQSVCFESNGTYGDILYVEFGNTGSVDLFTANGGGFTGTLPDATAICGNSPGCSGGSGGGGGGGGGGATGVTLPNGNSITSAATITYQPIINVAGGKIITFTEGAAKIELYDYVNTLGVGAGDSGLSIGITPYNACALNPSYVDANTPACATVGVSFDRGTGQVSFTNTPMHPIVFTCPGTCEINGSLSFTPY